MGQFECPALSSYPGTPPSYWFRYVDDTWVKIKKNQLSPFFEHINQVNEHIKFTQEPIKDGKLAFLDCSVSVRSDGSLATSVYRKDTHTDQYLLFDSHHPLVHKLGVIRTLFHRADIISSNETIKQEEHNHLKSALGRCGYHDWTFHKALTPHKTTSINPSLNDQDKNKPIKRNNITIPYVAGLSEKLRRIFSQHQIPVSFKPTNTLRQKLVHPKDKPSKARTSLVTSSMPSNAMIQIAKSRTSAKLNKLWQNVCTSIEGPALLVVVTLQSFHTWSAPITHLIIRMW